MQTTLERSRVRVSDLPETIKPEKLAHIVLKTSNYEAMRQWYLTLLNGRIALGNEHLTFITYDDEHHRIAIANVPRLNRNDPECCGLDHVAFTFADLGGLLRNFVRLREKGILPTWCINHGVTTSFYYKDPDGNKVELQIDNYPTSEELQHYFETDPDFASNPLGARFDPDKLIADYDAGVPMCELRKVPPYAPGDSPAKVLREMGFGSEPPA